MIQELAIFESLSTLGEHFLLSRVHIYSILFLSLSLLLLSPLLPSSPEQLGEVVLAPEVGVDAFGLSVDQTAQELEKISCWYKHTCSTLYVLTMSASTSDAMSM